MISLTFEKIQIDSFQTYVISTDNPSDQKHNGSQMNLVEDTELLGTDLILFNQTNINRNSLRAVRQVQKSAIKRMV